jgi:DNA-binding transcriptional ArsR family regulator
MYDDRRTMSGAVSSQTFDLAGPARNEIALADVLHALSDPVRLGIVCTLREAGDERRCGSFDAPVTKSTLTHHFRVLREAGLIVQRQEGTARLSRLRSEDLEARFPGVLEAILTAAAPTHPALSPSG